MSTYTDQILDAVDILVNEKVSTLQFDQTVRATIKEVVDASIGKYKVSYQNSLLYAYSLNIDNTYSVGTQVYIEIPSSDFNKDIIIVGPVSKLGINYVAAVAPEDRVGIIGNNLINNTDEIAFCSYKQSQSQLIDGISESGVYNLYKDKCDTLVLAANFRTALPVEQQMGGGNYGLKVKCTYINSAYKTPNESDIITREYIFNVDNMEGQPYKYTLGSRQVALFPIDGVNLKSIDSIEAFCENFPNTIEEDEEKDNDIFISDIELYLGALYTEEELSGSSLRIVYPDGNIIGEGDSLELKANLRIKGKAVNAQEQNVGFYWFKKDNSVTSSSTLYSPYGGVGWSCLNSNEDIDGKILFYVDNENKIIEKSILTAYKNIFKCVAIYNNNEQETVLSAQGELYNTEKQEIIITSSTGTNFSFNVGKATLICNYDSEDATYYWTQKIDGGVEEPLNENGQEIDVSIGVAAHIIEYSCTVYENGVNCGVGFITLVNESETKHGYTLIINNGTKIFKYDEYGVSPTSVSKAASDKMVLETLTFDIYNELGQKIDFTSDEEKIRACNIKWVFPNNNTLLTTAENLINDKLINVTTNTLEERKIVQSKTGFTYGIENWYNEWKKNNNIQLEVDYLDQHLVASTNFTFTKEGELGTNGTKYIARIIPNNADAIVIVGTVFYGVKFNNNTVSFISKGTNPKITNLITAQLWNGGVEPVSASVSWSIADTTKRAGTSRLELTNNKNNVKINSSGNVNCNILQATITYDGKKFYATYPIIYTTGSTNDMPWLLNGYNEVMYESDGTRGKFNGLPFTVKRLYENNIINPTGAITVKGSPNSANFGSAKLVDGTDYDYTLEPPSSFISETAGHYISVTANSKTTYFPIQLYLNRYGMSAMNDWDGTSIEINNDGSYILAPQIGAGTKNNSNQFTGITMGEVFQASNNKQVGLFGYHEGAQSIFLDAETGNAHFGISGSSRINIGADKEGEAPAGSIYSGNYYTYDDNGKPKTLNNQGMLIDLVTPSIQFGTGNFKVNANGHITAKGGGSIAGWQINDNELYSSNETIYLDSNSKDSNIPKIYGQSNKNLKHNSLNSSNNGFYLASDGLSIGSKFKVSSDGTIRVGKNAYNNNYAYNWEINGSDSANSSYIKYGTKGSNNSVYLGTDEISLGKTFNVTNQGALTSTSGYIGGWSINTNTLTSGNLELNSAPVTPNNNNPQRINANSKFIIYNDGSFSAANGDFSVTNGGSITAKSGTIGGWSISSTALSNHNITLNAGTTKTGSETQVRRITAGSDGKFIVWDDGSIKSTSGTIGGWSITNNTLESGNFKLTSSGNNTNSERININSGKFIAYNDGSIKATAGTIGGWNIGDHSLQAINTSGGGNLTLTLNDNGSIVGPTVGGSRVWQIESNGIAHFKNVIIDNQGGNNGGSSLTWKNNNETVFAVDPNGNLTAKLANIQGAIYADSGRVGDVSITGGGIGGSSWSINNSGMNFGNMFYVDTSGTVTAGNINATGGSIGGCAINNGTLQIGAANIGSCNANALKINGNDISLTPVTIPSFGRTGVSGIVHYTDISVPTTVTINGSSATLGGFQSYHVVEYIDTTIDGYPLSIIYDYGTYPPAGTTYYVMAQ